jgi:hypothetical protein
VSIPRPASEPSGPLSEAETRELAEAERAIRAAAGSFYREGKALETIRNRRLYRARYLEFEPYCIQVWDLCPPQIARLIGAAQIVDHLRILPIGNILPTCEGQARPLLQLSHKEGRERILHLDTIAEAWQEVVRRAEIRPDGSRRITARMVEEVVREWLASDEPDRPEPQGKLDEVLSEVERLVNEARESLPVKDWPRFAQGLRKMARKAEGPAL